MNQEASSLLLDAFSSPVSEWGPHCGESPLGTLCLSAADFFWTVLTKFNKYHEPTFHCIFEALTQQNWRKDTICAFLRWCLGLLDKLLFDFKALSEFESFCTICISLALVCTLVRRSFELCFGVCDLVPGYNAMQCLFDCGLFFAVFPA